MERNTTRRGITLIAVSVVMVLAFSLSGHVSATRAGATFDASLCGDGSAPDYGFSYELQQAHWTVNWQDYVSEQTVTEVDVLLDQLNGDAIAQTMILIQSQAQVGNRVNCAVHFLRYMQLGQPTGERKDNGFVFLIVLEPTRIDVHYGVGLGLPALTASELTTLNRSAEEVYRSTRSMDQALLTLVQGFDAVARTKYLPLAAPTPTPETGNVPAAPLSLLSLCGLGCFGLFFLLFLLWGLPQLARAGISFNPSGSSSGYGSSSRGMGFPPGGSSGSRSSPPSRGGSGSGRSGRGN